MRGEIKKSSSWREIAQIVEGRCRPTWQPRGQYTRGRKQVNPPAGSQCGIVHTGKDGQEPAGLHYEATRTVAGRNIAISVQMLSTNVRL